MQPIDNSPVYTEIATSLGACPLDDGNVSWQKTARSAEASGLAIECDATGVWQVRGFALARTILRSEHTRQAGFNAEMIARIPGILKLPILYQDGKEHHQQRKQLALFFAPKTVSDNYRQLIEKVADQLITRLKHTKKADLSQLSLMLAVRAAGQVIGLTNSGPGLTRRLEAFFKVKLSTHMGRHVGELLYILRNQWCAGVFFLLDVLPAIHTRKRSLQNDVISHLIQQKYSSVEILMECIMYAAAGMATTREFICVSAWHLLEQPVLRQRYLEAPEMERYAILHEILRLEPVIAHLRRRATADIELDDNDSRVVIPRGAMIDIHINASNQDACIPDELPQALCPRRTFKASNLPAMLMSFGDGAHRCPGLSLAIQETDIFLQRLLAQQSLRIASKPVVSWNDATAGYAVDNFTVVV